MTLFLILVGVLVTHFSITHTQTYTNGLQTEETYQWPFVIAGVLIIVFAII